MAWATSLLGGDDVVNGVAVGVHGTLIGDGVVFLIIAEEV